MTVHRALADVVLVSHLAFIVFVVLGGFLVLRWKWLAWAHVPSVVWAALLEFGGWICPLTPLESWLRRESGGLGYEQGFIEHHVTRLVYPPGLSAEIQIGLGILVLVINAAVYLWVLRRLGRSAPA